MRSSQAFRWGALVRRAGHIEPLRQQYTVGLRQIVRERRKIPIRVTTGLAQFWSLACPFAQTLEPGLEGFVEPGETIEDAVRRETREERHPLRARALLRVAALAVPDLADDRLSCQGTNLSAFNNLALIYSARLRQIDRAHHLAQRQMQPYWFRSCSS
jgi:hypothetical protein